MKHDVIVPDIAGSLAVTEAAEAGNLNCFTCGTCDNECPVMLSTGRLRPQKIIRMANWGAVHELIDLPDAWYCLGCRRCLKGCPNMVKPHQMIGHIRDLAVRSGVVSAEIAGPYRRLFANFQRVRFRAAARCLKGRLRPLSDQQWYQWFKTPLKGPLYNQIEVPPTPHAPGTPARSGGRFCFTCGECSSCCPVYGEGNVFDPQKIIRMVNLGLSAELLRSPSIWLCLDCQRCSDSCSQLVRGHDIIRSLQRQAVENGIVDRFIKYRLMEADRLIYPRFLDQIDTLLGLYRNRRTTPLG